MELSRLQLILQLITQVFYQNEEQRYPLNILGFNKPRDQLEIARNMFSNGIPVGILQEHTLDEQTILEILERDFESLTVIDFDGLRIKNILQKLADRKLFSTKRCYFIFGRSLEEFKETVETLAIHINSQISFCEISSNETIPIYSIKNPAQPFGGKFTYFLDKLYSIDDNGLIEEKFHAAWDDEMFDWTTVSLPISIVSMSCENSSVVTDEFLEWYGNEVDQSTDGSPRLGYSLFKAFQERFRFNFTVVCAQYWSVASDSGGAVDDLLNNKTVLMVSPMLALESRRKILDVVYPLTHFRATFTFQTPKQDGLTGTAFLKPFSPTLWISVFATLILLAIVMKKTIQVEIRTSHKEDLYIFEPSVSLTILSTVGVLCQQGMNIILRWNTSRILQLFAFLMGLVLYNYYTSLVVSDLISFPKHTKINSHKTLLESNLHLGAINVSYVHYYMKESELKPTRDLYQKIINQEKYFYTPKEGVALARRPGFVFLCETRVTLREMLRTYDFFELCNYHEISLITDPIYAFTTKHSPLTEWFRAQFSKTHEFGLAVKKDKVLGEPEITCLSNSLIEQVDIKYIAPIILRFLYVCVLSLIILICEIIWHKVEGNMLTKVSICEE